MNTAGLAVIATGDLNCNIYDPKDSIGRDWTKAMHSWGLADIMSCDNQQHTFRKGQVRTKIDYVFASKILIHKGFVKSTQILYEV